MADDKIEPTLGFEEGRDEAILATPAVSATVDGTNWKGQAKYCSHDFPSLPSGFDACSTVGSARVRQVE